MSYLTARRLADLEQRLSDRDRLIIETVGLLRLVSGEQLRRLLFAQTTSLDGGRRSSQLSLSQLVKLGVLTRLERRIGGKKNGSEGYVYGLGPAGQRCARRDAGQGQRARLIHEFGGPFVAHSLACSEVYVGLRESERRGDIEVLAYQSEPNCWRQRLGPLGVPITLRPDGFAQLGLGEIERHWFVEVDRGTENQSTIARQGRAYLDYYQSGAETGVMPRVAWLTTTPGRADRLSNTLHGLGGVAKELFVAGRLDHSTDILAGGRS